MNEDHRDPDWNCQVELLGKTIKSLDTGHWAQVDPRRRAQTMTDQLLSKEETAEFFQACREVAERAVALLQDQAASNRVDIEAAEDFTVWADSRVRVLTRRQSLQMGTSDDGAQWVLNVAGAGRHIIRTQAGDSEDPQLVADYRTMEFVHEHAGKLSDWLAGADQDEDTEENDDGG